MVVVVAEKEVEEKYAALDLVLTTVVANKLIKLESECSSAVHVRTVRAVT